MYDFKGYYKTVNIINTAFYRVFNMINYGTLVEFGYPKQSKY